MGGGPPSPINTIYTRTLSRTCSQHEESASMAAAALANVSYWSTESVRRLSRFQVPFSLALTLPSLPLPVSRALSLRSPPSALSPSRCTTPCGSGTPCPDLSPACACGISNFCRFIARFNPGPTLVNKTHLARRRDASVSHVREAHAWEKGKKERRKDEQDVANDV
jgi:hypothetical protein